MDYCETEGCDHRRTAHAEADTPSPGACRITGCPCGAFNHTPEPSTPRRISIDVPDGYSVHISLVPVDPAADPDDEGDGR